MSATLPSWMTSRRRPATRWLALGSAAAALAVGFALWPAGEEPGAAAFTPAMRQAQAHCAEAALLVHDVRWAAACTRLAEAGQGDGSAECDLPPAQSAALYAVLQEAEQGCAAEARDTTAR
jgi:hypothetical protein